jgi:adenylate cyclase
MPDRRKLKGIVRAALAGGGLVAVVGLGLVWIQAWGGGLARLSYDLPFECRSKSESPADLVMVYLDQNVKATLGVPLDQPLARPYHTRLIRRLKADGPRIILYDIIFDEPDRDSAVDEQFAAALQEAGTVVLVGYYEKELTGNAFAEVLRPPIPVLAKSAAGWGLAGIWTDPDRTVREINAGAENCPSASWVAAARLQAPASPDQQQRLRKRWLNYYAPPSLFRSVRFDQVIDPQGVPAGYFHDKIVVVGAPPTVGLAGAGSEDFGTPYSRFGRRLSSGAEIHALSLLNLLRGDWLEQMPIWVQLEAVALWGFLLGAGLMFVRPWHAAWVTGAAALLISAGSVFLQLHHHVWWPWLIPAAVQSPVALVWSVVWQYALESRKRKKLRQAFAGYLSPHLADRIADGDFDLSLGGKVVEATVMFTDLDGFTAFSENLNPQEVSLLLTTYFNQTTRGILEEDGTIIKYMGDAVMAVWGAPLPDPRQAERAVLAAWGMVVSGRKEIFGKPLRTRIGINSGPVLAGNLGSDFRFDYATIGDTTNTASRLEGLNKVLGTEILVSEATRCQLGGRIRTRALGRFLMAGKSQPVAIHEVLGVDTQPTENPAWAATFDKALQKFTAGKLDSAAALFHQAIEVRGGADGPSSFYLKEIEAASRKPATTTAWDGVVIISSK